MGNCTDVVFCSQQLHNHYVNHTYTDIGNNLLNTYERYFLAYEHAHPEDVPDARCVTCEQDRHGKPGQMLRCDSCGDWCVVSFHLPSFIFIFAWAS